MKYTAVLLSALLITFAAAQTYSLIDEFDLEVNKEAVNCINAKKLLDAAESDKTRLKSLADGITTSLVTLKSMNTGLNQACNSLISSFSESSFLEAASVSFTSLATLHENFHKTFIDLGFGKEFQRKLASHLEILNEISEDRQTMKLDDASLRCEEAHAKVNGLNSDLNKVLLSVQSNLLNTFLVSRVKEINQVLDKCPITQTGSFSKSFLGTGHEFEKRVPRSRFEDYKIKFDQPFTEVPEVAVSLTGFDLDTELPSILAAVPKVTESDFTLRLYLVPYARLYSAQVSYLATLPESSGIYPKLHIVDYQHDKDFAALAESTGPRSIEKKIELPEELKNNKVGVVTFINGFSFGAGADARMKVSVADVSQHHFKLRYSTAGNSRFLSAVTYNLLYKKSGDVYSDANELAPSKEATFYKGFGPRSESTPSFSLGTFKNKPEIFYGLFAFDFSSGYGYRVSQDMSLQYKKNGEADADLTFKTIGDTKLNLVKSSMFYTCQTRKC